MRKVILGISGSIAAYKAGDIASYLSKKYDTHVVMTKNALNFISPTTFKALTRNEVMIDEFNNSSIISHIDLSENADLMIIAPATANIIGKLANGIADDILSTTALSFEKDILIAPAMNTKMYLNPIVQENIEKLKKHNRFKFIEPRSGVLACKAEGIGKLAKVEDICAIAEVYLNKKESKLKDKNVLVVSGPTQEKLDPVRILTNISSGQMGEAIATAFMCNEAKVSLLSTIPPKTNIYTNTIIKQDSNSIYKYLEDNKDSYDVIVMVAAISDVIPQCTSNQKLKKDEILDKDRLSISFCKNIDILNYLSKTKKDNQVIIGFSAETDDVINNSIKKLNKKGCDYIIANDVSRKDIGFNSSQNEVYVINKDEVVKIEKGSKFEVSLSVLDTIFG